MKYSREIARLREGVSTIAKAGVFATGIAVDKKTPIVHVALTVGGGSRRSARGNDEEIGRDVLEIRNVVGAHLVGFGCARGFGMKRIVNQAADNSPSTRASEHRKVNVPRQFLYRDNPCQISQRLRNNMVRIFKNCREDREKFCQGMRASQALTMQQRQANRDGGGVQRAPAQVPMCRGSSSDVTTGDIHRLGNVNVGYWPVDDCEFSLFLQFRFRAWGA